MATTADDVIELNHIEHNDLEYHAVKQQELKQKQAYELLHHNNSDHHYHHHNHNHNNNNSIIPSAVVINSGTSSSSSSDDSNNPFLAITEPTVHTYKLRNIEETPDFLRCPYIYTGYRCYFSPKLSLLSLFKLHNETFNTHTHLAAFIFFLGLLFHINIKILPSTIGVDYMDYFLLNLFILSCMSCWLFSSIYHLFGCISEKMHTKLYCLDMSNIAVLILGSYIPGLYYAFLCRPIIQIIYIVIILSTIGIYFLVFQTTCCGASNNRTNTFYHRLRIILLSILVVFALIPTIHFAIIHDNDFPNQNIITVLLPLIFQLVSYGIGFLFYLFKFPECKYPGLFDIYFHSHQFWHVFVSVAAYIWYQGLVTVIQDKYNAVCNM